MTSTLAPDSAIDFNPSFVQALERMEQSDRSLFITGKAGTGKSTLLAHFCSTTQKHPVVLAPTGVAALNVGGQTIHRFFRFPIDITPQSVGDKRRKPRGDKRELYRKLRTLIIDEVSMLRADLLDCIDGFLRLYGPIVGAPFGGVQMIFVGDLYQLPPVVGASENAIFTDHYATPYFFSAHALKDAPPELIELETVYRQKDPRFVDLLNSIRNNSVEEAGITLLNQRVGAALPSASGFSITLTSTNRCADEINEAQLAQLSGKSFSAEAEIEGEFGKEYYPTATTLQFKIGAQIMLLNNDSQGRWVNGSIGVIEAVKKDDDGERYLQIRLQEGGESVSVTPHRWEVFRFSVEGSAIVSEAAGFFKQFPLRLAWAITIHKSQGKTFDQVVIDIGSGTFAAGQMYVALSRCTSFEGITLRTPIKKSHIRTDYRIFSFLTGYHYRKAAETLSHDDKLTILQRAIAAKARLKMVYLKANDSKSERIIQPRSAGTENYQGKLFPGMRAWCETAKEERMFHIGRILALEEIA